MAKVTVCLDADDYSYLCDVARANGMLVTEVARWIITDKIIEMIVGDVCGSDQTDPETACSAS